MWYFNGGVKEQKKKIKMQNGTNAAGEEAKQIPPTSISRFARVHRLLENGGKFEFSLRPSDEWLPLARRVGCLANKTDN